MSISKTKIGVVIPIYRPGPIFAKVLDSLQKQDYPISKLILIDSSPQPWNEEENLKTISIKTELVKISPTEFDHGGTRNFGASLLSDLDAIMFLTHDAIMNEDCISNMVKYLETNCLSAAFAKQLPREGATEIENFERSFNYPKFSYIKSGPPTSIDDVFFSNVCSLVKTADFMRCGCFPDNIITAEDLILAVRMLNAEYKIGYCSEATVKHSHKYGFWDIFKRYFDTGVMNSMWKDYIPAKTIAGKGMKFVLEGFCHILTHKPGDIFRFVNNVMAKAIGYYLGKKYNLIPRKYRRNFSANKAFWS